MSSERNTVASLSRNRCPKFATVPVSQNSGCGIALTVAHSVERIGRRVAWKGRPGGLKTNTHRPANFSQWLFRGLRRRLSLMPAQRKFSVRQASHYHRLDCKIAVRTNLVCTQSFSRKPRTDFFHAAVRRLRHRTPKKQEKPQPAGEGFRRPVQRPRFAYRMRTGGMAGLITPNRTLPPSATFSGSSRTAGRGGAITPIRTLPSSLIVRVEIFTVLIPFTVTSGFWPTCSRHLAPPGGGDTKYSSDPA